MSEVKQLDNVPEGFRVTIHVDEDPQNPRDMSDDPIHVLTVPGSRYIDVDADPGPWGDYWRRLLDRHDWSTAIEMIERYARTIGAYTYDHAPVEGARSVWYLTREDGADWDDPAEALEAYAKEYEAWANGEVYGYVIEREATWQRIDGPNRGQRRNTWEHVDSLWGFYGPDTEYVEQEARATVKAIADHERAQ